MKLNLYSVYDDKAKVYSQPMVVINDEVAIRIMRNCANNNEHNYGLNPEDFKLFKIGEFDDSTSKIEPTLEPIVDLITLVKNGD